ncbi:MAG TPA: hypothetical protein VL371_03855 [Gemmataceae bacterium]|jgi:hypothetical protein|nr:hypothetical protein [Gemmataceae bacterium]
MTATAKRASDLKELQQRVGELEKQLRGTKPAAAAPWWKRIIGKFADDPIFEEVVKEVRKRRRAEYAALKVAAGKKSLRRGSTRNGRRGD